MMSIVESAPTRGKIVVLKNTVADVPSTVRSLVVQHGLRHEYEFQHAMKGFNVGILSEERCAAICTINADVVDCILNDFEVKSNGQIVPWGIQRIGATDPGCSAHIGARENKNVDVFVLDTGVSSNDLNVVESRSFATREKDTRVLNGHGTAVAGVIAARDNTQQIVGIAPGARIHSYKVLDRTGSGTLSSVIAGIDTVIQWKRAHPAVGNAVIINLSLGAFVGAADSALDTVVKSAIVNDNITVVVAAGNDGNDTALYTPARVPEALTVGAYDIRNTMPTWSNYGSLIDVLAPGVNIITLSRTGGIVSVSGTSFSAPHVAGAAALILTRNPSYTPQTVRNTIKHEQELQYDGRNPPALNVPSGTTPESVWVAEL